ncbi:CBS domain-containing protein [bacterium]|nr:CBS domain-containing protein [bacterium]
MEKNNSISKLQELAYELKIRDIMTTRVTTVLPTQNIKDLRKIMHDSSISGTPVMENGKLIGIISIEDFIRSLVRGENNKTVQDIMTHHVETLCADEPVIHAVAKFEKFGYGRFPIVERKTGELAGIITKSDIIKGMLRKLEIDYREEEIHRYRASHLFEDVVADHINLTLEYNVQGQNFHHAGEASSRLKKTLQRMGLPLEIVRRAAIASYEIEMNIVIYTNGGKLTASLLPGILSITAVDKGPGIPDIQQAMQPGFSTATTTIREMGFGAGMGLPNVKKYTDDMQITSTLGKGTEIITKIYLKDQNAQT